MPEGFPGKGRAVEQGGDLRGMITFKSAVLIVFGVLQGMTLGAEVSHTNSLKLSDIRVRDPFILADSSSKTYYLYAQGGNKSGNDNADLGVMAYRSKDLVHWSGPERVFERPKSGFWGNPPIWAPEVHKLGDAYYMFATFFGRSGGLGTQILRSASPNGPFQILGPDANTPAEWEGLDGSPCIDPDGTRWLVFCHAWSQIKDGTVCAVRMNKDWTARLGESIVLFRASEAPWVRAFRRADEFVTDGPFLYRTKNRKLLMIWSSFRKGGNYALGQAESESGTVKGPWKHSKDLLFGDDGGHGMIFKAFTGELVLVLHQPNGGNKERAKFFKISETDDRLKVDGPWDPETAGRDRAPIAPNGTAKTL